MGSIFDIGQMNGLVPFNMWPNNGNGGYSDFQGVDMGGFLGIGGGGIGLGDLGGGIDGLGLPTFGGGGGGTVNNLKQAPGDITTTPPYTSQSTIDEIIQILGGGGGGSSTAPGASSALGPLAKIIQVLTGSGGSSSTTGSAGNSQLLGQILSMVGLAAPGIYGAVNQQNQNDWNNAAKISTLNYLQQQGSNAQGQMDSAQAGYLPQLLSQLGISQNLTNGLQSKQASDIGGALSNAPGAFNGVTDLSRVPGTSDIMSLLNSLQGKGGSALNSLQGNLTGGPLSTGLQTATGLSNSQNPYAQQLQQIASGLVNGQSVAQPNSATSQAQQVASQILGKNPLLSMDQVKSMAIDQNARNSINSANTLRRQLLDRTGVTGPAIASGSQNELLGSLQDQGLQNQASGVDQAMLGQQNLQSQLFGQGASLFGAGQGAQNATGQMNLQQILGGAGLLSGTQGSSIAALNALANLAGTQNSGYGTLGSLLGTLSGSALGQQGALQGVQNFGLQSQNDLYSQLNNLLTQQGNAGQTSQAGLFNAANYPQNTYNQNLGFLQNLASNNVGLFGNPAPTSNLFSTGNLLGPGVPQMIGSQH